MLHEFISRLAPLEKTGVLVVINTLDEKEKNACYKADVAVAKQKKFKVFDKYNEQDGFGIEYAGSNDPSATAAVEAPTTTLYPNPASEYVLVETTPFARVLLLNAQGLLLDETSANHAGQARFSLSSYAPGVYVIQTEKGQHSATSRIDIPPSILSNQNSKTIQQKTNKH